MGLYTLYCLVIVMATGDMREGEVRRGNNQPSSRLFIKNLWYGVTEDELKEKFDGCTKVNIPVDPKSGNNKG